VHWKQGAPGTGQSELTLQVAALAMARFEATFTRRCGAQNVTGANRAS
jgi:hypothetical protein